MTDSRYTRIQKNRGHAATIVVAVFGLLLHFVLTAVFSEKTPRLMLGSFAVFVILLLRTILIESSVRRSASNLEQRIEQSARRWLWKHLGLSFEEPVQAEQGRPANRDSAPIHGDY